MPDNPLYPGYVVLTQTTPFSVHKSTLPTRAYAASTLGALGTYEAWDGSTRDAGDMIADLVNKMAELFAVGNWTADYADVYSLATPTSFPTWRATKTLGVAASGVFVGAWYEAVQETYTMRTLGGGFSRIVLLDKPTNNAFGRYTTVSADEQDMLDEWMASTNAWSGRDGTQPFVFKNATVTLNERLRREYHLT